MEQTKDVWQKAIDKRKKKEDEEKSKKNSTGGSFEYEDIQKMSLEVGKEMVFRPLGIPYQVREKPTDSKFVYHSRLVRDDGKGYTHINWKMHENEDGVTDELDDSWILKEFYDAINKSDWVNYTEEEKSKRGDNKRGEYIPRYKHFKSYQRIIGNSKQNEKYPPNFYPKKRVVMNVIDKHNNWCIDNKHSKVLYSKVSPYTFTNDNGEEQTIEYINDIGIPISAYNMIFENVVEFKGNWNIDIVMQKNADINNAYEVRDASENKIKKETKEIATDDELSIEEKQFELYDLDKLYKVSSYGKIRRNLIGLFKQGDLDLGTDFTERLNALADIEADEMEKANREREENEKQDDKDIKEEKEVVDVKKDGVKRAVRKLPESDNIPMDIPIDLEKVFPKLNELEEADKKDIINANPYIDEVGQISYRDCTNLYPCDNKECGVPLPSTVLRCPVCGTDFNTSG